MFKVIPYCWLMYLTKNFQNLCLKICAPDPVHLFSALELGWRAALKYGKTKLELLTDIHTLLMVEKGEICGMEYAKSKRES